VQSTDHEVPPHKISPASYTFLVLSTKYCPQYRFQHIQLWREAKAKQ